MTLYNVNNSKSEKHCSAGRIRYAAIA